RHGDSRLAQPDSTACSGRGQGCTDEAWDLRGRTPSGDAGDSRGNQAGPVGRVHAHPRIADPVRAACRAPPIMAVARDATRDQSRPRGVAALVDAEVTVDDLVVITAIKHHS